MVDEKRQEEWKRRKFVGRLGARGKQPPEWSPDDTAIALYQSLDLPFGKIRDTDPVIEELAKILKRGSVGVAQKIGRMKKQLPEYDGAYGKIRKTVRTELAVLNEFKADPPGFKKKAQKLLKIRSGKLQEKSPLLSAATAHAPDSSNRGKLPTGKTRRRLVERNNEKWERRETLAAFNLYCRMPFRLVNSREARIVAFAKKLGRTSASLSIKMGNLAWNDPEHLGGLGHGSKLDKQIWEDFFRDPEAVMYESEHAFAHYDGKPLEERAQLPNDAAQLPEGREKERIVRVRVNQAFFRSAVLAAYNETCCITRLAVPELLNASHIVPWKEDCGRLNPSNGLCLNALHDRAFDRGLITVRTDGFVAVSEQLREKAETCKESAFVVGCDGVKILMPDKFEPATEFLEWHGEKIFRR